MKRQMLSAIGVISAVLALQNSAFAATIDPFYAGSYSLADLGAVAGLPAQYGGLTVSGNPNTLLIGGGANTAAGRIYQVGLARDSNNHITGFAGIPAALGTVDAY